MKFHENPSSGSRVVPGGWEDIPIDRQTDTTKLSVNFQNSTNAPKKYKASNHVADWFHDFGPMAIDCRHEPTGVTALCTPIPVNVRASVTHE